uniref:BAI1 associated protein 3 n=1 Tax=Amphilophus citrinellus TaxID=61819 RepID=A0A3Q0T598_AMPCI
MQCSIFIGNTFILNVTQNLHLVKVLQFGPGRKHKSLPLGRAPCLKKSLPIQKCGLDLLYEEAVYTVVNRVGVPSPEHVKSDDELFAYLLKVSVCLSVCLSRASFSLRVSVMKAKNLMAKDANGYSDPYCMLGILKRSSTKEVLPARCIQVTEVKPETLNPVWDEHFVLTCVRFSPAPVLLPLHATSSC